MTANQIAYGRLLEDRRHNRVAEGETARHNTATETQAEAELGETHRANLAREGVEIGKLQVERTKAQETKRSNLVREAETERSNRAREDETARSNMAREIETNRANVAHELETYRSNTAKEAETYRSNIARELETERSNRERERETARHNRKSENLDTAQTVFKGVDTVNEWRKGTAKATGEIADLVTSFLPFLM